MAELVKISKEDVIAHLERAVLVGDHAVALALSVIYASWAFRTGISDLARSVDGVVGVLREWARRP